MRKGCSGTNKIAILPQFLTIDPHFVRKGCSGTSKIAILPQFLTIDPHFVRKGCSGTSKIAIERASALVPPTPLFGVPVERGRERERERVHSLNDALCVRLTRTLKDTEPFPTLFKSSLQEDLPNVNIEFCR